MTENDALYPGISADEWDMAVFLNADHFTVSERVGRGQREQMMFHDYAAAAIYAYDRPQALLYAVTGRGMARCIVRSKWLMFLQVWKKEKGIN